uniref:Uncharacterized protein n=1 Tax=Anguilla anguilla TaxID=7936 RepID=A0A0E9QEY1_ANGAN
MLIPTSWFYSAGS